MAAEQQVNGGGLNGERPARWQGTDRVFFHRRQIRVGVELVNFGRLDHGARWVVIEVRGYPPNRIGRGRARPDGQVQHLGDDVILRRAGGNEAITRSFAALSYSAAWRLA